ncbi:SpoIIE family protein phosphatase [Streptomyces olivaceoviridis]
MSQCGHLPEEIGLPLGVDPGAPRPDHECRLSAGATVLLHTDGLVEERGHPIDEGMRQAAAAAADHAADPLPELCEALLAQRQDAFHDDVALLAARLTA